MVGNAGRAWSPSLLFNEWQAFNLYFGSNLFASLLFGCIFLFEEIKSIWRVSKSFDKTRLSIDWHMQNQENLLCLHRGCYCKVWRWNFLGKLKREKEKGIGQNQMKDAGMVGHWFCGKGNPVYSVSAFNWRSLHQTSSCLRKVLLIYISTVNVLSTKKSYMSSVLPPGSVMSDAHSLLFWALAL